MKSQQLLAKQILDTMVKYQVNGQPLGRVYTLTAVRILNGCVSSADKLLIDGRHGEVGVYLLTLIFNNLKPKQ